MTLQHEITSVAVILPSFNERNIIGEMVASVGAFAAENPHYSFLFVDDGSDDGTDLIISREITRLGHGNISFLRQEQNRGKGYAVKTGFAIVEADALCFIDSDMAYSLDHLKLIEEGLRRSDVVIGSRRLPSSATMRPSLRRYILGQCFNWLVRHALGLPYQDTQAGIKGFRFDAARRILEKSGISDFCFDVELLFIARKLGYEITEIPVTVSRRHDYKKGKLKLLRDSLSMFYDLLLILCKNYSGKYDQTSPVELGRRRV